MSVKNFQDAAVRHILEGLREKVSQELNKTVFIEKDKFIFNDPDLREITGKDQLGVVSQRGLQLLSEQFGRAATINSTFEKLIKEDVDRYQKYPAIYSYLKSDENNSGTLLRQLSQEAANLLSTTGLFQQFYSYYTTTYTNKTKTYMDVSNNITGFTAETTEHAEFNKQFKQFLLSKGYKKEVVEFIDANTDAGHLLGVFNIKFATLLDLQITQGAGSFTVSSKKPFVSDNIKEKQDYDKLVKGFENSLALLSEADSLTGNLLSDLNIEIDASKVVYGNLGATSAVEIQLSNLNQRAGQRLAAISRRLNELRRLAYTASVDSRTGQYRISDFKTELSKLFKSFEGLNKYIEKIADFYVSKNIVNEAEKAIVQDIRKRSKTIFDTLLETSGSDSIITSIDKTVFNPLRGLPKPKQQNTKVPTIKSKLGKGTTSKQVPKVPKTKLSAVSKALVVRKTVQLPKLADAVTNLNVLMMQINSNLHDQIKKNMGTGNRRDVLNYRTGRFAQSAEVKRMSESREGMITAFYSYMKNPYATFSRGGRQERPFTRDPKLLISKSIRELAGTQVANRMRAVLV